MVVLDGEPAYTAGHSGMVTLVELHKVASYQTMAMVCKPANPRVGETYAQIWCAAPATLCSTMITCSPLLSFVSFIPFTPRKVQGRACTLVYP